MVWQPLPPSCATWRFERATNVVATKDRGPGTDGTLHCSTPTSGAWAQISRVQVPKSQVPTGGCETASSRSGLEADTSRDGWRRSVILSPTVLRPDTGPWNFDECECTSARKEPAEAPCNSHENSPVSGASVMEMTTWVGQRHDGLPASAPGISLTTGQRGWLSVKGRLHEQPTRFSPLLARAGSDKAAPNHLLCKSLHVSNKNSRN
jgi:hypothetical protein